MMERKMTSKSVVNHRAPRRNGCQRARYALADELTLEFCARLQRAHRKYRTKHARLILNQWTAYLATLPMPDDNYVVRNGDDAA
jgi:hypothetical protein